MADNNAPLRQPGWVLLIGVLGAACLMMGLILLAMIQAPAHGRGVVLIGGITAIIGAALLLVAWFKRVRKA